MTGSSSHAFVQTVLDQVITAQRQASDPEASVWVAASAGSGKTKVLTDRLLRLLLEGVAPEKILCLTYTRAAASEMQQRLFTVLEEWCLNPPYNSLVTLLGTAPSPALVKKASSLFYYLIDHQDRLRIMTLHGFCQSLLQQFSLESGCLPGFKVLEENETVILMEEVFQALLSRLDLQEPLAVLLNTMSPNHLQELLMQAPRHPWMDAAVLEKKLGLSHSSLPFTLSPALLEKLPLFDGGSALDQKRAFVMKSFQQEVISFKELASIFLTQNYDIRSTLATKTVLKQDSELETLLQQEALRVRAHLQQDDGQHLVSLHQAFITLHQAMQEHYIREKKSRNAFDFQDILEKTFQLLNDPVVGPWVLFKVTQNLDHVLVDEAQDTSSLQWAIILKLTEDFFTGQTQRTDQPTLFVVGDFKQSIYGFQGAQPHLFQSMQAYYREKVQKGQSLFYNVSLDVSFRSAPQVLAVVDQVFHLIKGETSLRHESARLDCLGSVQRWPVIYGEEDIQASFHMADQLARFIALSLKQGFQTAHGAQPVQPKDFLILVQRRHGFLYQMIRALKRYGVPVMGADRYTLQDDLIIKDILALFRFLLFPYDTFSLVTVLISPLMGWSYDKVAPLLADDPQQPLWKKISKDPEVALLRELLKKTDHIAPSELLFEVIETPGKREAIQERLGQGALDSVDALLHTVLDFEACHVVSLQGFVAWFDEQSVTLKRDVAQNPRNEVRLMTVHGAKGLQAPIVILPDTTTLPGRPPLFLEDDDEVFLNKGQKALHPYLGNLYDHHKAKTLEEYYRLLYVALTRAENHLIIAGWNTPSGRTEKSWYHWLEQVVPLSLPATEETPVLLATTPCSTQGPLRPAFMDATPPQEKRQDFKEDFETATLKADDTPSLIQGREVHRALEKYMLTKASSPLIETILKIPALKALLDQGLPEVPLVGILNGQPYAVRLDCVIQQENVIKIIDFKSDQVPTSPLPVAYGEQLKLYKCLAQQAFEGYTIQTFILWTVSAELVEHI